MHCDQPRLRGLQLTVQVDPNGNALDIPHQMRLFLHGAAKLFKAFSVAQRGKQFPQSLQSIALGSEAVKQRLHFG